MAGAEGERLAAAAGQRDVALAAERETRDRHGIGPGPGLLGVAARQGLGKGALQEHLRQDRLGGDPGALSRQREAADDEKGGRSRPPRLPL
ncbi:hypothetical protein MMMDOFMJ_4248 [Methylobacterium gnaphalii]|nr:hypothetical protein MMMDOFMJ_4248 [Methylobacterium gnaphalii]